MNNLNWRNKGMADIIEKELGWDDEISNDDREFAVLPEGDYRFTVEKFERGRSKGSGKLPPCNMAILTLRVTSLDGSSASTVTDYLVLHSKVEWKISSFFRAVGLKKHGEPLRMEWSKVYGSSGRLKLIVEHGDNRDFNKVDKYYDPDDTVTTAPAAAPQGFWN